MIEWIKFKIGYLKGVKIVIMGCIVNGFGEMVDVDFGYVGGGLGTKKKKKSMYMLSMIGTF